MKYLKYHKIPIILFFVIGGNLFCKNIKFVSSRMYEVPALP